MRDRKHLGVAVLVIAVALTAYFGAPTTSIAVMGLTCIWCGIASGLFPFIALRPSSSLLVALMIYVFDEGTESWWIGGRHKHTTPWRSAP
jgi:hypothetical protein